MAIPDHILEVLADRTTKAQIVKPSEHGGHPGALGRLPAHLADAQNSQGGQAALNGLRVLSPASQHRRTAAHPIGGKLPARRQINKSTLLQLDQQGARRHVL